MQDSVSIENNRSKKEQKLIVFFFEFTYSLKGSRQLYWVKTTKIKEREKIVL